jgi:hypothetical protein
VVTVKIQEERLRLKSMEQFYFLGRLRLGCREGEECVKVGWISSPDEGESAVRLYSFRPMTHPVATNFTGFM